MIKKIIILMAFTTTLYSQNLLKSYSIGDEEGTQALVSTPASNSIQDIIANDEMVILGTSRGLSISFDDGHTLDWYPVICDLCGGAPECARICPTDAIFIAERTDFSPVAD